MKREKKEKNYMNTNYICGENQIRDYYMNYDLKSYDCNPLKMQNQMRHKRDGERERKKWCEI